MRAARVNVPHSTASTKVKPAFAFLLSVQIPPRSEGTHMKTMLGQHRQLQERTCLQTSAFDACWLSGKGKPTVNGWPNAKKHMSVTDADYCLQNDA